MKYAEINKIFSDAVAKKLAHGFTICTNTMAGHQGEIAKVNFIDKDGRHYSLILKKELCFSDEDIPLEAIVLYWVRSNELQGVEGSRETTFWIGGEHVTIFEARLFWIVSKDFYTESKEEAVRIKNLRRARLRNSPESSSIHSFTPSVNGAVRKLAAGLYKSNKARWQKPVKTADINTVEIIHDKNFYKIIINGDNANSVIVR